ncbi:hypothetical protein [Clavibacter capsici]|uniref:hypothetical protein n=1 Tax=Clavibacter capsici TaxID=1874630 RepID=UPI00287BB1FA|nr:hypothetical protein [Clavibacter capsici]
MTTGYDQSLEGAWDAGFDQLKGLNASMYQGGVYPNGNNQVLDLLGTGAIEMAPSGATRSSRRRSRARCPRP